MHAFERSSIPTARLILRPLSEEDIDALFRLHSDPVTMRYWSGPAWKDAERGKALIARDQDASVNGHLRLGIESNASGELIGTCTFFEINTQCRRAEMGYMLASGAWGQGYMREALLAFIDHGFSSLDLNRIEADTDPRNERSMQLLLRIGFVKEGHFRERWIVDGEVSDAAMFGLLRRDWHYATQRASSGA